MSKLNLRTKTLVRIFGATPSGEPGLSLLDKLVELHKDGYKIPAFNVLTRETQAAIIVSCFHRSRAAIVHINARDEMRRNPVFSNAIANTMADDFDGYDGTKIEEESIEDALLIGGAVDRAVESYGKDNDWINGKIVTTYVEVDGKMQLSLSREQGVYVPLEVWIKHQLGQARPGTRWALKLDLALFAQLEIPVVSHIDDAMAIINAWLEAPASLEEDVDTTRLEVVLHKLGDTKWSKFTGACLSPVEGEDVRLNGTMWEQFASSPSFHADVETMIHSVEYLSYVEEMEAEREAEQLERQMLTIERKERELNSVIRRRNFDLALAALDAKLAALSGDVDKAKAGQEVVAPAKPELRIPRIVSGARRAR